MGLLDDVQKQAMKETLPEFKVGDVVDVHVKIQEGGKERVQVFNGTVIARGGSGMGKTFTVRRIVAGEGVERTFPIHSPTLVSAEVTRRGRVRRAKLYYLRDRVGKSARVREKRREKKIKAPGKTKRPAADETPEEKTAGE